SYVFLWARHEHRPSLGANALVLGVASGFVTAGVAWGVVNLLGAERVPVGGRYGLLALGLVAVPAGIVLLHLSTLLALDNRIVRVNAANVVGALIPFAATLFLFATSRLTLTTAISVWVLFSILPATGLVTAFGVGRADLSIRLARRAVTVGLKYHIAAVALFLLVRVDIFLLNANVSPDEVGRYALAVALVELTFVLTDSLAQVILPRQVEKSLREAGVYTVRIMRASLIVSIIIVFGVAVSGYHVVPLIFGEAFRGSASAILSLAPGIIAFAMIRTLGGVLIRLDRPFLISGATMGALALNVALNLLLIPHFGILGAGAASSAAYVLLAAFFTAWLLRATSLPLAVLLPRVADFSLPATAIRSRLGVGGNRKRTESGPEE
ncbi:MAG TPA: polysaccharide biosynthesis C-terminal domain-containing protein, partial [Chloroflexota bacterium]|nr:polysaccharide biosynthesis C-terminal domain-containing protein [Chloroflexota bacterium]